MDRDRTEGQVSVCVKMTAAETVAQDQGGGSAPSDGSFRVYRRRWAVLFSFCALSCSSAWIWITWSPISVQLAGQLWRVPTASVDQLAAIYLYIYVVGSPVSLYFVRHGLGLYRGLLVGGTLNLLGALVRYLGADRYGYVYLGTLLAAVAQTFTLSTPPLIASRWFAAQERATATATGVLANQMGTLFGLGAPMVVELVKVDVVADGSGKILQEDTLVKYLKVQCWVSAVALILVASAGRDFPPTPPSAAAAIKVDRQCGHQGVTGEATRLLGVAPTAPRGHDEQPTLSSLPSSSRAVVADESLGYVDSVLHLLRHRFTLLVAFCLSVGAYYTIPTFLAQLLPSYWTTQRVAFVGLFYQLLGIGMSLVVGIVMDRTQQHRLIGVSLLFWTFGSLAAYSLAVLDNDADTNDQGYGLNEWCIFVSIVVAGGCLAAWNTVGMEFATVICPQSDEAAVAGALESGAELAAFIMVVFGDHMIEKGMLRLFVTALASTTLVACWLLYRTGEYGCVNKP